MAQKVIVVTLALAVDTETYRETYGMRPDDDVMRDATQYAEGFVREWMSHHLTEVANGIRVAGVTAQ